MNTSMGGDSEIPEAGPQFAEFFSRKPGRGSLGNFLTIDRRIAASPCSTWAGCRGRGSANSSGHYDLVTTARTYTHVLADEAELDYLKLLA
jgi:hypothetical protein